MQVLALPFLCGMLHSCRRYPSSHQSWKYSLSCRHIKSSEQPIRTKLRMTCDHEAEVNMVKLSTIHFLHSPRKKKLLVLVGYLGLMSLQPLNCNRFVAHSVSTLCWTPLPLSSSLPRCGYTGKLGEKELSAVAPCLTDIHLVVSLHR